MAANFFRVPMAGVSLVDQHRVWFKSRVGISTEQTARDAGLCSSTMLSQGVYYGNNIFLNVGHSIRLLGPTSCEIGFAENRLGPARRG
jgi:hypothetical protein